MSFSLLPRYKFDTLLRVTPEFLRGVGVSLLLLDLDNTIAPYGQDAPDAATLEWAQKMRDAGITLFIVSNSRKTHRVSAYAAALDVGFVYHARKPSPAKVYEAAKICGSDVSAAALAGDQIFTDVLAANRADAVSLLVKPIRLSNVFLALRYAVEQPFRIFGKKV